MQGAFKVLCVVAMLQVCNATAVMGAGEPSTNAPTFAASPNILKAIIELVARIGQRAARAGGATAAPLGTAAIAPEVVEKAINVTKPYYGIQSIIDRAADPNGF